MSKQTVPSGCQQITSLFAFVQGPTTVNDDPNAWLPPDRDAGRPTRRTRDGTLQGRCSRQQCKHPLKGIKEFAPGDNGNHGVRTRLPFMEALADYHKARGDRDVDRLGEARAQLEKLMTKMCARCRDAHVRSQNRADGPYEACKQAYRDLLAECGVDGVAECADCGAQRALSLEHPDPETKERDSNGKTVCLSKFNYWKHSSRGPAAMREEARKNECITLCAMFHKTKDTGAAGRRIGTVAEAEALPDGKRTGTPEEVQAYKRKRSALVTAPRYEYNDALKLQAGGCANPACPADGPGGGRVKGFEVCYEWNHTDPETKPTDTGTDMRTIRSVCNWTKRVPEAEWKARIDADRARCELLCANCHHEHTWGESSYAD